MAVKLCPICRRPQQPKVDCQDLGVGRVYCGVDGGRLYDRNGLWFENYQRQAVETRIYSHSDSVIYPALGMAGEAGEVCDKIKKRMRITNPKGPYPRYDDPEFTKGVSAEIGDVLWYLANLAEDLGLNLSDIATQNLEKLRGRQERGTINGSGDDR